MKTNSSRIGTLHKEPTRPDGFTLVELLVTISIIATLAALVMTVTAKIRGQAFQANAMSSLRQVAAFNLAYSTENSGNINTLRYVGDPKEGKPYVSESFWGRLQPYLFPDATASDQKKLKSEVNQRLDLLFNSPDADTMVKTILSGSKIYHDGSGLPVPLAFNSNLHKWNEFLKVSSFGDPSQVLYTVYGFGMFNEADGKAYVPMPKDRSTPKNNIYYLEDRKALAAFLDGHVELIQPPIPDWRFK